MECKKKKKKLKIAISLTVGYVQLNSKSKHGHILHNSTSTHKTQIILGKGVAYY